MAPTFFGLEFLDELFIVVGGKFVELSKAGGIIKMENFLVVGVLLFIKPQLVYVRVGPFVFAEEARSGRDFLRDTVTRVKERR